jgi:hypothetical protein
MANGILLAFLNIPFATFSPSLYDVQQAEAPKCK